jgi:hypothetical protein
LYKAITTSAPSSCNFAKFAWENHAPHPPRARLFAWLLVQQPINYKSNLHIKAIVEDLSCDLCRCRHLIISSLAAPSLRTL